MGMEQTPATLPAQPGSRDGAPFVAHETNAEFKAGEPNAPAVDWRASKPQKHPSKLVQRILVPTDFSPASEEALSRAVALAHQFHAALTLLHIIDVSKQSSLGTADEFMQTLWAEGSAQINRVAGGLSGETEAQTMLEEGLPWEVIVEKSTDFDLLVLGQRCSRSLGKFFCANTVRRVLKDSGCPVMVVPAQT